MKTTDEEDPLRSTTTTVTTITFGDEDEDVSIATACLANGWIDQSQPAFLLSSRFQSNTSQGKAGLALNASRVASLVTKHKAEALFGRTGTRRVTCRSVRSAEHFNGYFTQIAKMFVVNALS